MVRGRSSEPRSVGRSWSKSKTVAQMEVARIAIEETFLIEL